MAASAVMSAVVTTGSGGPDQVADSTNGDRFRAVADAIGSRGDGSDAPTATDGDDDAGRADELSDDSDGLHEPSSSALVVAAAVARSAVDPAPVTSLIGDAGSAASGDAAGSAVAGTSAVAATPSSELAGSAANMASGSYGESGLSPIPTDSPSPIPMSESVTPTLSDPSLGPNGSTTAGTAISTADGQPAEATGSSPTPADQEGDQATDPATDQRGPRSTAHAGATAADTASPGAAAGDQAPLPVPNTTPAAQTRTGSPTGTEATVPPAVRPPVDDDPNIARLTGIARSVARSGGSHAVSITLTPGDLGSVRVEISTAVDGRVSVHLAAEQAAGAHVLRNATSALRSSLEAEGIQLDQVSVGSDGVGQQAGESGRQRIFEPDARDGSPVRPSFGSAAPSLPSVTQQPTYRRSSGLDLDL